MIDWLTRMLLSAAGTVVSWFEPEGTASFHVAQGVVAMLLITSVVALLASAPRASRW